MSAERLGAFEPITIFPPAKIIQNRAEFLTSLKTTNGNGHSESAYRVISEFVNQEVGAIVDLSFKNCNSDDPQEQIVDHVGPVRFGGYTQYDDGWKALFTTTNTETFKWPGTEPFSFPLSVEHVLVKEIE